MEAIENSYSDAVRVLLELKSSISRWTTRPLSVSFLICTSTKRAQLVNNLLFFPNPFTFCYPRLLSKSLFPYNIGPVFRLLERVETQHATVQQLSWHMTANQGSLDLDIMAAIKVSYQLFLKTVAKMETNKLKLFALVHLGWATAFFSWFCWCYLLPISPSTGLAAFAVF